MRVLLTFDVEVWCGNWWKSIDERFPSSFERCIYGQDRAGGHALPKTLEILNRHGLKGVFFVEPLFAGRFGVPFLREIVELIRGAGQEVQLHLHPEWAAEIDHPATAGMTTRQRRLGAFTFEQQKRLIGFGLELMASAGAPRPAAFRAGSFAASASTFRALRENGVSLDFSIDAVLPASVPDLRDGRDLTRTQVIDGVTSVPMAVFRDGFGKERHAQIGACAAAELIGAMEHAARAGKPHFVILSHGTEMQKPWSPLPDRIVARRFESVCQYLGRHRDTLPTGGVADLPLADPDSGGVSRASVPATTRRYVEQAVRRYL